MKKIILSLICIFLVKLVLQADIRITERLGLNSNCQYKNGHMDAYLSNDNPNSNYGSVNKINMKTSKNYAILYFDLSNIMNKPNIIIHQARLNMYIEKIDITFYGPSGSYSGGSISQLFAITNTGEMWKESEVTYNNRTSGTAWSTTGNIFSCIDKSKIEAESWLWPHSPGGESKGQPFWTFWDITELVKQWIGGKNNQGVLIEYKAGTGAGSNEYTAISAENTNADQRPYLEITYSYSGLTTNPNKPQQASAVKAFHRSGQTFITWEEVKSGKKEEYAIYRYKDQINKENIEKAKLLAIIPKGSSYFSLYGDTRQKENGRTYKDAIQKNFIITDLGPELSDTTGLFVYTVQSNEEGDYYYAVTSIVEGNENREDFGSNIIKVNNEKYSDIFKPVLIKQDGGGRLYTQWMDYSKWSKFEGYAYIFHINIPKNYNPNKLYPLSIRLHAYESCFNYFLSLETGKIDNEYTDGGFYGRLPDKYLTWWYGYLDNAGTNKPPKYVVNYTEARVCYMIKWLISGIDWKVDKNRVNLHGGSMGGTGSWTVSIHHPELFSSVYASKGINAWPYEFTRPHGWGSIFSQWIGTPDQKFPAYDIITEKEVCSNVWNWENVREYVLANMKPSDYLPFYGCDFGTNDGVIYWDYHGYPMFKDGGPFAKLKQAIAGNWHQLDHNPWFCAQSKNLPASREESVLAFTNGTCNEKTLPERLNGEGTGCLNYRLEWSSSVNNFAGNIVDEKDKYEVIIRLCNKEANSSIGVAAYTGPDPCTADITPRRLQKLEVSNKEGYSYDWENIDIRTNQIIQIGNVKADEYNLITIPNFKISSTKNKLVITVNRKNIEKEKNKSNNLVYQSYPNPFNPECYIPYELKNSGDVKVRIYNVLGQKVRELELGQKQASKYITKDKAAYWDGKDNKGKEVVSGVYYYELVVDSKVIGMKKSLVLK